VGDGELRDRCLTHDREAWDEFVRRFSKLIYSVVFETLRRHGVRDGGGLSEDLHNATFLALYDQNYKRLRQWTEHCSLASWVRLVAASTSVDHLRRRRPEVLVAPGPATEGVFCSPLAQAPSDSAEGLLLQAELIARLGRALEVLSEPDRALLVRLFADEASPEQLARELGILPGALYTRKNRALARLRAAMELAEPTPRAVRSGEDFRPMAQVPRRAHGVTT
jgi:RNA polymerase sigma-70 factor (ECF subfamily)